MNAAKFGWRVLSNAVVELEDNAYAGDCCAVKRAVSYIEKEWRQGEIRVERDVKWI
jgi:hypothetical protein